MDGQLFQIRIDGVWLPLPTKVKNTDCTNPDIDWLVPHQNNLRIIEMTAPSWSADVIVTLAQHGNTSAASIPLDTATRRPDTLPAICCWKASHLAALPGDRTAAGG